MLGDEKSTNRKALKIVKNSFSSKYWLSSIVIYFLKYICLCSRYDVSKLASFVFNIFGTFDLGV